MKSALLFPIVAAFGILQATALAPFAFFHAVPDLLFLSVIVAGFFLPAGLALGIGVFAGALKDLFSTAGFGVSTFVFSLWAIGLARLTRKISIENEFVFAAAVFIICLLNAVAVRMVFLYFNKTIAPGVFFRVAFLESLYTAAVSFLFYRGRRFLIPAP